MITSKSIRGLNIMKFSFRRYLVKDIVYRLDEHIFEEHVYKFYIFALMIYYITFLRYSRWFKDGFCQRN